MNPFLSKELAVEHVRDLREEAARRVQDRPEKRSEERVRSASVRVRLFAERDIDGIRELAALDEQPVPTGAVLVAEEDGELVAALPLDGGHALADPFKPTADIVALLQMRARQLNETSVGNGYALAGPGRLHALRRRLA